jgi:protein-L-isoaspartate(D-aspartate) O-methyltransferase
MMKEGISYGIDHIPELVSQSRLNISRHFQHLLDSHKVILVCGDGRLGYKEGGPYDCIHVGASAETVPKELIE